MRGKEVKFLPTGNALDEFLVNVSLVGLNLHVNLSCSDHHFKEVIVVERTMGILFGICIGVVQPVEYTVGIGAQIGRTLENERLDMKELFPELRHGKLLVRRIPVMEKGLTKQRQIPV